MFHKLSFPWGGDNIKTSRFLKKKITYIKKKNTMKNYKISYTTYGELKRDGFLHVELNGKDYLVHNLVAETFLNGNKPIPKGYKVIHKNGNPIDNRADNLEIVKVQPTTLNLK